ncbi:MAG TPA: TIGR00730 family Rossman fold protein [Streptosporangiaceae bacterium]|jgi:hypothetical protein
MRICVFLSATSTDERYAAPVRELAGLLASGGHDLVWGGSDAGLMKVLADAVQDAGGTLTGVSVESLRWVLREKLAANDEIVVTADLASRKAAMLARCDAVLVMPGGTGTLDELTDVMELKRHGVHRKPVVVVNVGGYYDGLAWQLRRMEEEGFLDLPADDVVRFAPDVRDAMAMIEAAAGDSAGPADGAAQRWGGG